MMRQIELVINDRHRTVEVASHTTLLEMLRDQLKFKSVKPGCWSGDCGLCLVLIDGRPIKSCLVLAQELDGTEVVTVEGLLDNGNTTRLHQSFIEKGALQCGYCTPAFLLASEALLRRNPHPTRERVCESMNGILCRCTGYKQIIDAILAASE